MNPISGAAPQPAAYARRAASGPVSPPPASSGSPKPVQDEYVPEEKREPCGRYWLEKDGGGAPRIRFDAPEGEAPEESAPAGEEAPKAEALEGEAPGKKASPAPSREGREEKRCTSNTDQVDREIERLKEKKEQLERRLFSEKDETRREQLERQLAQVESELRRKDNDAYRRGHAVFTED